jgi:hypothetical protein
MNAGRGGIPLTLKPRPAQLTPAPPIGKGPYSITGGEGSIVMSIPFGITHGQDEIEALFLSSCAVIVGVVLLSLAWLTTRVGSTVGTQNTPKRSVNVRVITLALLGGVIIAGGIGYGQLRMNQIDVLRRKEMEEIKEKQRTESRE